MNPFIFILQSTHQGSLGHVNLILWKVFILLFFYILYQHKLFLCIFLSKINFQKEGMLNFLKNKFKNSKFDQTLTDRQLIINSKMNGQNIPKATLIHFFKKYTTLTISSQVALLLPFISKIFIIRIGDKANQHCQQNNKSLITPHHIETALESFGLQSDLQQLRKLAKSISEVNTKKRKEKQLLKNHIKECCQQQKQKNKKNNIFVQKQVEQFNIKLIQQKNNKISKCIEFDYQKLTKQLQEQTNLKKSLNKDQF